MNLLHKRNKKKALNLSEDKVIYLLKIQFLESKERKKFLENSPLKYIYVFSERQNTMRNGLEINPRNGKKWSSTLLLAWFIKMRRKTPGFSHGDIRRNTTCQLHNYMI